MLEYFDKIDAQIKTANDGTRVKGKWQNDYNGPVNIKIIAPQPLKANELEMLPEGERTANWLKTWIAQAVYPRQELKDSSIIVYAGKQFLVYQTNDWFTDGSYYRVVMREITPDESRYRL